MAATDCSKNDCEKASNAAAEKVWKNACEKASYAAAEKVSCVGRQRLWDTYRT